MRIAVVGGGWAGCAAAVELASRGHEAVLIEAARALGGRARRVAINDLNLDNGQHILLGAYSETLRCMRVVGIDCDKALLHLPLQMRYPATSDGMDFAVPRLPAPLHLLVALLRSRGLERADKMALARFSTTARWMDWQLHVDCSVGELLERYDQTDRLIRLMWRPLCIAALNTPPERASAQVFLHVLRDSLGAKRSASDMLIPRVDLSALFPEHAASHLRRNGGTVMTGSTVSRLRRERESWLLDINGETQPFDGVIVATQPAQSAALLQPLLDMSVLTHFEYEPITTCYLQYAPDVALDTPLLALLDDASNGEWGQFVFDRGQLDARHPGLLAVVVSASGEAIADGHDRLARNIAFQLAKAFGRPEFGQPLWYRVISEKRATFSCTPGLRRPPNETGLPGLVLAGDYTAGDYPATLESAVRSGVAAACLIAK